MTRSQNRRRHWSRIVGPAFAVAVAALAIGTARAEAELLTGLTSTGNLVTFDSATPGTINSSVAITGLAANVGVVPEPASLTLLSIVGLGLISVVRRRR